MKFDIEKLSTEKAKKLANVQGYIEARIDLQAEEEALAELGINYTLNYKASLLYILAKVDLPHISHKPASLFVREWLLSLPFIVDLPYSYAEQREQLKEWGFETNMHDIDVSDAYYALIAEAISNAAILEKAQVNILQKALKK